ncbi:MAG: hydrogenase maturation nickel metallochaperone HypA [Acidobacteriia bacterium]|nr:hydrogenase maturation nickel metallochaperone HypA [Terriglobia bacterium]
MHELSIAQNILEIVQQSLPPEPAPPVKCVRLKIGEMAGVVTDSLEFCFSVLISDTTMGGAKLEIESVPVMANCKTCGNDFRVEDYVFACPSCSSSDLEVLSGRELQVVEVELADEKVEVA